jgi:isomerase DpgB
MDGAGQARGATGSADPPAGTGDPVFRVDGRRPLSAEVVAALGAACDRAEDRSGQAAVIVHVTGAPGPQQADELTVALLNRWERGLRRLERLPAVTIAVADGDCGGPALDALLATDYRIATAAVRLLVPVTAGATWPGMALYRLAQQAGAAAIRRAVLFGSPIEAPDALALHLLDELTSDAASGLAAASGLGGSCPGTELAIRRQLMFDASAVSFEEALGAHLAACDRALRRAAAGASR